MIQLSSAQLWSLTEIQWSCAKAIYMIDSSSITTEKACQFFWSKYTERKCHMYVCVSLCCFSCLFSCSVSLLATCLTSVFVLTFPTLHTHIIFVAPSRSFFAAIDDLRRRGGTKRQSNRTKFAMMSFVLRLFVVANFLAKRGERKTKKWETHRPWQMGSDGLVP